MLDCTARRRPHSPVRPLNHAVRRAAQNIGHCVEPLARPTIQVREFRPSFRHADEIRMTRLFGSRCINSVAFVREFLLRIIILYMVWRAAHRIDDEIASRKLAPDPARILKAEARCTKSGVTFRLATSEQYRPPVCDVRTSSPTRCRMTRDHDEQCTPGLALRANS
jgi:hypothetical protein